VPAGYDLTVGHHTHLPQPFEQTGDDRLVAWSLGNFITGKQLPVLGEGALLRVGVACPGAGPPEIVRAQFREIDLDRNRQSCRVSFRHDAPEARAEAPADEHPAPGASGL
jgi:poly-gamma-glutamate capsule biosynthesis protein CapA/YwtB (metallophosphatase superfamily)